MKRLRTLHKTVFVLLLVALSLHGAPVHAQNHERPTAGTANNLYRFYSPLYSGHFYTASLSERDFLIENNSDWDYEGIAYSVENEAGHYGSPVYVFIRMFFRGISIR